MTNYTYEDFLSTLDQEGHRILNAINEHITSNYSEYKAFDMKTQGKLQKEWVLYYRKKPKVGKAICEVRSVDGKIQLRFPFLTTAVREFLLRQNDFSDSFQNHVLKQTICVVSNACRCYGGKTPCPYQQHFWMDTRLIKACPYPWIYFSTVKAGDIEDIKLLIDLQMRHMTQNPREIKGSAYTEDTIKRCEKVRVIDLDPQHLDMDRLERSDYTAKPERLSKYTDLYNLIPMGANDGLWYFQTNKISGAFTDCATTTIPKGRFAAVTIADPMTFSANRVWNYLCEWISKNNEKIAGCSLGDENAAFLIKFYKVGNIEYMSAYVPLV